MRLNRCPFLFRLQLRPFMRDLSLSRALHLEFDIIRT
jgi:hypothetical protein